MQPHAVEPRDVLDDRAAGGGPGRPRLLVEALALKRGEEALGESVVPTSTGAPDRERHDALVGQRGELRAGVLATPVRVEDHFGAGVAGRDGIGERVGDQFGAQMISHREADHTTAGDVEDGGEVEPATDVARRENELHRQRLAEVWDYWHDLPDGPERTAAARWYTEWTGASPPFSDGADGPLAPGVGCADADEAYDRYIGFLDAVYNPGRLGRPRRRWRARPLKPDKPGAA